MTRFLRIVLAVMCSNMLIGIIAEGKGKTIYTSSINHWTPESLALIINSCEEGSTIVFDADYDYTIDRCLRPNVSITIRGNGKILRTINPNNYVISLFDVRNVNSFKIDNLILDGGYRDSCPSKTIPKNFFITIINVNDVAITNCTLQNIRTAYPNWKKGDEAYTIWVENYNQFQFTDNIIKNVRCAEFLKAVLPIDNTDPKRIANISRNQLDFESTSTAIEVRFGRYRINNNEISMTRGSCINAFGFNSEIVGNYFHGSHNSSSIDLSEQFAFKYISHDILVKDNYSEYAKYGFLMANTVHDVTIKNNTFMADICDDKMYEQYDKIWYPTQIGCDRALMINGDIYNVRIQSNHFQGANALLVFNTPGHRRNIEIDNNYVQNINRPGRSSLVITQVDGMKVRRNSFISTGSTFSYFDKPQFIVVGPTDSEDSTERYVRNLDISNNHFSLLDKGQLYAYIFAHTVYDRNNCGTLSTLSNIKIRHNKASFKCGFLLVSDDFALSKTISIKRNKCNGIFIEGNVFQTNSFVSAQRKQPLEANTFVEKEGKTYYVVVGGITSQNQVMYHDDMSFFKDGDVVLRRVL